MASSLLRVVFRVSQEEYDWLERKADKKNLSISNFLREVVGLSILEHGGARKPSGRKTNQKQKKKKA